MTLLCCRSDRRRPRKQWRRKGNIELNMTECTALLKQQSKKKNKLGKPRTMIEQGMLLVQLPLQPRPDISPRVIVAQPRLNSTSYTSQMSMCTYSNFQSSDQRDPLLLAQACLHNATHSASQLWTLHPHTLFVQICDSSQTHTCILHGLSIVSRGFSVSKLPSRLKLAFSARKSVSLPICAKVERHSIVTQYHPETFLRAEAGMCFSNYG